MCYCCGVSQFIADCLHCGWWCCGVCVHSLWVWMWNIVKNGIILRSYLIPQYHKYIYAAAVHSSYACCSIAGRYKFKTVYHQCSNIQRRIWLWVKEREKDTNKYIFMVLIGLFSFFYLFRLHETENISGKRLESRGKCLRVSVIVSHHTFSIFLNRCWEFFLFRYLVLMLMTYK